LLASLLRREAEEGADGGQLACGRGIAEAGRAAGGEKGAQVGGGQARQGVAADGAAKMSVQEVDQPVRRRSVGAHRVRRAAAALQQMVVPARGQRPRRRPGGRA
jgi:hypothetical protein